MTVLRSTSRRKCEMFSSEHAAQEDGEKWHSFKEQQDREEQKATMNGREKGRKRMSDRKRWTEPKQRREMIIISFKQRENEKKEKAL